MSHERRNTVEPFEIRSNEQDGLTAVGYGAVFGKLSQNLGGFVEQIDSRAFNKSLGDGEDVRALFNHDPNMLLGRVGAGTLRMGADSHGLRYEIDLPDTPTGIEVAKLLERGDLSGSSFGFRAISDSWGQTEEGYPLRTLESLSVRDVGPVTFPAYPDSDAALRSLAEHRSVDLADVAAAAKRNELSQLISEEPQTVETPDEDPEQAPDEDSPTGILSHERTFGHIR